MHSAKTLRALGATLLAAGLLSACNDEETTGPVGPIGDAVISADITTNRTLSADTVYTIQGFIKVTNGATLFIEAGGTAIDSSQDPISISSLPRSGIKTWEFL